MSCHCRRRRIVQCRALVTHQYSPSGRCEKIHNIKRGLCVVHRKMKEVVTR